MLIVMLIIMRIMIKFHKKQDNMSDLLLTEIKPYLLDS